ncbi:MAG: PQQ-dependent sugar dehydrogenase [Flavobacteriales bacterium]
MFRGTITLLASLSILYAKAQSPVQIALEPFATGLSRPVGIANAGDDRLFVVQEAGRIRIVEADGTLLVNPFLNITSRVQSTGNEQGLLGLAFDPNYATNGFFYVYYINGTGAGTSRISRFSVSANPDSADENSEQILYTRVQPYTNHNGGQLNFGPDGYLYAGFGDGGDHDDPQGHAQNLTDALGDIIRIDVSDPDTTYTIPPSNPYAVVTNDTLPEIWASGVRNPWRWGFDALTGDVWIGDVGQDVWEEVDFWPAGDNSGPNFGWRCREGLVVTSTAVTTGCPAASAFISPVKVHSHSSGWCSVIGGRVYRGTEFPRLYGRYIYSDYCPAPFESIRPDGLGGWIEEQVMNTWIVGLSSIAENSAKELFATNVENGKVYRIVDTCPMDAPVITANGEVLTSTVADSYVWFFNGTEIPGATGQSHTATASGGYQVLGSYPGGCELLSDTVFVALVGMRTNETYSLRVHPIPATDKLTVEGLPLEAATLSLVDLTGRTMMIVPIDNGGTRVVADVHQFANGNYILVVNNAQGAELLRQQVSVNH